MQNFDPHVACESVFLRGATGPTDQRRKEVEQFLEIVNEYRNLLISRRIPCISRQTDIAHAPVHDAGSIFWLIVLFFLEHTQRAMIVQILTNESGGFTVLMPWS